MKHKLKILSIDGSRGSGKTSQINMLSKTLTKAGRTCYILKAGHDPETGLDAFKKVSDFLSKNEDGLVILDGSIARPMVTELLNGMPTVQVMDKYNAAMHDYEVLNKNYGLVGLLLVMDDMQEAKERLEKVRKVTGDSSLEVKVLDNENDIVSGMRTFNNHVSSKNIKFYTFSIEKTDSIMSINKAIIDYLSELYDIPKPTKDYDDW